MDAALPPAARAVDGRPAVDGTSPPTSPVAERGSGAPADEPVVPVGPPGPIGERGRPVVAAAVLVTSVVAAVAATGTALYLRPPWDLTMWFTLVDVVGAVVYGTVAWVLLNRLRHAVAWCFALTALGCGVAAFAGMYAFLWDRHPDLWAARWIAPAVSTAWLPGTLSLVVVVPWLVRTGRPPAVVRGAIALGWALIATILVARLTNPLPWPDGKPFMPLAIRSVGWSELTVAAQPWLLLAVVVLGLVSTGDVVRRWRWGPEAERVGLGWLAIGSALMALSFVPLALPQQWSEGGGVDILTATPITMLLAQAFLPAAVLVAVLRQQMWSIDLAVSRTLVWVLLTGGLVALYVTIVVVADRLVDSDGVVAALAAVSVALALNPARTRLQRSVDHLVHGTANTPSQAIRAMSRQLRRAGVAEGGEDLLDSMAEGLRASLRLAWVGVEADADDDVILRASAGAPEGEVTRVPLELRGRTVGHVAFSPPAGVRLDVRSRRTIDAMVPVMAAGLSMVEMSEGLRRAEVRLTSARVEERRILRRDLHDGLGPALAGISLGLQAYRNVRDTDPRQADSLLDVLAAEVDQQAQAVRSLSRALLPPVLEELGLDAALEDLAARHRSGTLDVQVRADVRRALPAAVATATYAIASEALVNVQRHARARTARIEVATRPDELVLVVRDDGVGLGPSVPPGVGLLSMRERAQELRGSCTVANLVDGGVEVAVALPLGVEP